jgi:Glutamate dehydrogenase/leucine dehydrogenase
MTELSRYIHPYTDVPAGDIGVGGRELGYLYGQYKKLTKRTDGVLTGKPLLLGGSEFRIEATGFGVVYISQIAAEKNGGTLQGARCAVSGSGNVAQYAAKKLIEIGAKVVTMSDSNGTLVFQDGMTMEDWNVIIDAKQVKRARLSSLAAGNQIKGEYHPNHSPWAINDLKAEYAFPCATQNEIDKQGAELLIQNGIKGIFEGANLPTTIEAQKLIRDSKLLYIPGKAANAGGVATSGFEMAQNAQRLNWEGHTVDEKLKTTMQSIYNQIDSVTDGGECTLEQGANRAGFLKVAEAMKSLGWIW